MINWNSYKSFGGSVPEALYNRLVDACHAVALQRGVGYNLKTTPCGTTLQIGGASAGEAICPFDPILSPNSDSTIDIDFAPGSVNSLVPTNMFDTNTIDISGTYYVFLTVLTDGKKVTSSTLNVSTGAPDAQTPVPFALPSTVNVLIGLINNGKPYRLIGCGSIVLDGNEEFRLDKNPPAQPGQLVYTPYYIWKVSTA